VYPLFIPPLGVKIADKNIYYLMLFVIDNYTEKIIIFPDYKLLTSSFSNFYE